MKRISLVISLAFLLGFGGMAQKYAKTLNGKAPQAEATKKNPYSKISKHYDFNALATKQIRSVTTESFEGSFPPAGWTKANPDGGTGWAQLADATTPLPGWNGGTQDVPPGGGGFVAYCTWNTGGAASNDQWLISPQISVIASDSLSFYLWFFGAYIDTLEVLISTTGNSTADFTTQLDLMDTVTLTPQSTWKKFSYSLAPYAGQQIYVAFRERVSDNQTNGAYIALDLFSFGSTVIYPNDISPTALVYPTPADLLTAADPLTVTVTNLDSADHFNIPISCQIDGGTVVLENITDTIPALSSISYTFSQTFDFSTYGHVYDVLIYTDFPSDGNMVNDTLMASVYNDFDAATVSIDMVPVIGPGTVNPMATVQNVGSIGATFDVVMNIDTYTSVQAVTLAPGASQQVTFDPWNATVGNYTIEVYTMLTGDMDMTNDTLTQAISVQNLTKAYCYVAYDPSGVLPTGPAYTYLQDPGTIVSLADQSAENFVAAGTWGLGNKWYGAVYSDNTLITLDTVSGARTVLGNSGVAFSGLAFDYTTNTLFGVDWNGADTSSNLYRVNTSNGSATFIGTSSSDLLINLACDTNGNLYSVGINNDLFYSINKSTGLATSIGSIGFDASYAQDMEFDLNTNICYMADYNATASAGDLSFVNIATGLATSIGTFAGGAEITGFSIPYNFTSAISDAGIAGIISPSNDSTCTLSAAETVTVLISNLGNTPISNFDVSYQINSGTVVTETVTSTIQPFGTLSYSFSTTEDLSALGTYDIVAYTTLTGDFNNANDTAMQTVASADALITVNILTDDYGSETTWELINNSNSQVVASGGPYDSNTNYSTYVCVQSSDCFTFNIYDSYGDGICCSYGNGTYEIVWNTTSLGIVPGSFTTSATVTNICDQPLSVTATSNNDSICLGDNAMLTATGAYGSGTYTYAWSNSAGTTASVTVAPTTTTTYVVTVSDGTDTATDDVTVIVVDCSGVNEIGTSNPIIIFPNPAKDVLNINAAQKIESVKLLNVFGQMILNNAVNGNNITISTSALADGVYYLQIETAEGIVSRKISVIR